MNTNNPELKQQIAGASWKIASCFCFAAINGIVRYSTGGSGDELVTVLPDYVLIFFQNLIGTLFMLPFIISSGKNGLKTNRPLLHILRVIIAVGGVGLWYRSLYYLPMADTVALSFTGPIFTVIGAIVFLKEKANFNRMLAITLCFVGSFIIVRPDNILLGDGADSLGWPALLPLGAAIAFAASKLLTRILANLGESAHSMTFYLLILMAPVSLIPAAYDWVTPSAQHWPWLIAMGVLAACAHYTLTKSLAAAEVSFVMPFGNSKLLMSAAIGYFAFGEVPKSTAFWLGSLIIILGVAVLSMPERKKLQLQTN